MHNINFARLSRLAVFLAAILAFGLAAHGAEHTITSLPYTCSTPGDTYRLSGNLYAPGRALTIEGANVHVNGGGDTIWFNTAGSNSIWGIFTHDIPCTIESLTVIQFSETGDSVQGIRVGGTTEGVDILYCNVHVKGADSRNVYTEGVIGLNIYGGNYTSFARRFVSRGWNYAACLLLNQQVAAYNGLEYDYNYRVCNITIDSCPHTGIVVYGKCIIDSNTVYGSARNEMYTYPSDHFLHSAGNAFMIAIDNIEKGTKVRWNKIRNRTNHHGCRGIYVGQDVAWQSNHGCEVAYNDIDVSQGFDEHYGWSECSYGIRVRAYATLDSAMIHHNLIKVYANNDDNDSTAGHGCTGIAFSANGIGDKIYNNHVVALASPYENGLYGGKCYGLLIEHGNKPSDTGNISFNNYLSANTAPLKFGSDNCSDWGAGSKWISQGDTIVFASPTYTNQYGFKGPVSLGFGSSNCYDNILRDPIFIYDSTIATASSSGTQEITTQKTLKISVMGNNALPVRGAFATVTNDLGDVVMSEMTSVYGRCSSYVYIQYDRWSSGSHYDSTYNPFTIVVRKGNDSSTATPVISFSSPEVSVTLAATAGEEVSDSIPPNSIEDLGATTGDDAGEIKLTWSATGDDGDIGGASVYLIKYATSSISESDWNSLNTCDSIVLSSPLPAGDLMARTAKGLDPGQLYYFGLKAYDYVGNISGLSNIASAVSQTDFSLGGDEPPIATVSPPDGMELNTYYPTFLITNIDTLDGNIYYFEISLNNDFVMPVVNSPPVLQEDGGVTSWVCDTKLSADVLYYWRAGTADNEYSNVSTFIIKPKVHAYPNPFRPAGGEVATFTNVPVNSSLYIKSVSGSNVRYWTNNSGNDIIWDGTNESGNLVSSGTYLWFIGGTDINGKLILIR